MKWNKLERERRGGSSCSSGEDEEYLDQLYSKIRKTVIIVIMVVVVITLLMHVMMSGRRGEILEICMRAMWIPSEIPTPYPPIMSSCGHHVVIIQAVALCIPHPLHPTNDKKITTQTDTKSTWCIYSLTWSWYLHPHHINIFCGDNETTHLPSPLQLRKIKGGERNCSIPSNVGAFR